MMSEKENKIANHGRIKKNIMIQQPKQSPDTRSKGRVNSRVSRPGTNLRGNSRVREETIIYKSPPKNKKTPSVNRQNMRSPKLGGPTV